MRLKIILILISSILFLPGCFHTMEMSAVASSEQEVGYGETITSQKQHFVSLAPYREYNSANADTAFILFVKNCGEYPFHISSENMSVKFYGNIFKSASIEIAVLSFDDLINIANQKKNMDFMNAYLSEGKTATHYSYSSGNLYTTTVTSPTVPGPNQYAREVEELAVKPQTLLPGQGSSGLVVFDTSAMGSDVEGIFQIKVFIDGEQHDFTFSRKINN